MCQQPNRGQFVIKGVDHIFAIDSTLKAHLPQFDSLEGLSHVAVAVSGGSDSLALLRLVLAWRNLQTPLPRISALTVDHGLRAASADEAVAVARWCASLAIPHHILPWRGEKPKTGLQAKARVARYDIMAQWCLSHCALVLLTGHTADDQAETVLMRSARTSSDRSLAGIWPERDWQGVRVMRPLLASRREHLRDYLTSLGQEWIDDPSNLDPRFERVRVRQALAGRDISPLQEQAAHSLQVTLAQQSIVDSWMAKHGRIDEWGCIWLPRSQLSGCELEARLGILRHCIQQAGGSDNLSPDALRNLQDWAVVHQTGRRTLGGALVMLRRDHVLVAREAGRISRQPQLVPAGGQLLWDERFMVTAPPGSLVGSGLTFKANFRLKNVPHSVQLAMPHVKLAGGDCVLAQKIARNGVSATICEPKPK